MGRPLTQREIKRAKRSQRTDFVIVENRSKQALHLQLSNPDLDFYLGESTIVLRRNKNVKLPLDSVMLHQLQNLQKRGMLTYRVVIEEDKS